MKKYLILFIVYFPGHILFAQDFQWAKSIGGINQLDQGRSVAIDAAGNVYSTGNFQGTVDFDPGPGIYNLTALGDITQAGQDIFISKLDAAGNFLWAKSIGSGSYFSNNGFTVDVDPSGNVYLSGNFGGTADFDPGPGVYNLTAANLGDNTDDFFILKLDAAGNFLWAKAASDNRTVNYAMTIDASGNCLVTGFFNGTVDFDPGPGVYNLSSPTSYNCYILKLDPSGNFVWAKMIEVNGLIAGHSILVDNSDNIYLGGFFTGTADFDMGSAIYNLSTAGGYDAFISKYDSNGNLLWAHNIGGAGNDQLSSMVLDNTGNIYATGDFENVVDFDPGPAAYNLTSFGSDDIFIVKMDTDGNFTWAKNIGGTGDDFATSMAIDASNNIYISGGFSETVDFDPGPSTYNLSSLGGLDLYISKFDSAANMLNTLRVGGAGNDYANSIIVDAATNTYLTGVFEQTVDFDPGPSTYDLSSLGAADLFILKLMPSVVPVTLLDFSVSRNNNDALLTWKTESGYNSNKFEIERSVDGISFTKTGELYASGNSNGNNAYHFTDINAGINFPGKTVYYRFKQIDPDGKFILSPVRSVKFDYRSTIVVYPNPASDFLKIETNISRQGLAYHLTDVKGNLVLKGELENTITIISIRQLPDGVYFLHIDKETKAIKIMKQ